jgi:hypothetical protein
MVYDDYLLGAEELLRYDQGPDRVVGGAASGIADNVGIAFLETEELGRVEPGVHTGKNRDLAAGWHGQVTLIE